jgi:MFS family permease
MSRVGRSLLLSHVAGVTSLAGVQAVAPALPVVQEALDLSDSQAALVMSAYLLPSVLFALPAGFLADRFGRRAMFVGSCILFGLSGGATLLVDSLTGLLVLRVLQGTAFAALLPLSITMLGDVVSGREQVRQQGLRAVYIAAADLGWPLIGAGLAVLTWTAPFASAVIALPLAVLGRRWLEPAASTRPQRTTLGQLVSTISSRIGLAVQSAGFLRFLFKHSLLTLAPLLLYQRGSSPWFIAIALAVSAGAAMIAAAMSARIMTHLPPSRLLALGLVVFAGAFFTVGTTGHEPTVLIALAAFGLAEGLFSVISNAMLLEAAAGPGRATFVAVGGTIKNLAKFLAPTLLSVLVLALSLESAFLVVGVAALACVATTLPLRALDSQLVRSAGPDER